MGKDQITMMVRKDMRVRGSLWKRVRRKRTAIPKCAAADLTAKGGETLTGMAHMVRTAEKNVQVVEQEMTENGWTLSSQTNWDRPNVNVCTARGARTLYKHLRKKLEARKKELQKMKDDKKKVKPSAEENGMEA